MGVALTPGMSIPSSFKIASNGLFLSGREWLRGGGGLAGFLRFGSTSAVKISSAS